MNQPITTVVASVHYIDKTLVIILRGFVEGTGSHRHYSSPDCISKLWQERPCRKPFPMTVALKSAFRGGRRNALCHVNTRKDILSRFSTRTRFLGSALLPLGKTSCSQLHRWTSQDRDSGGAAEPPLSPWQHNPSTLPKLLIQELNLLAAGRPKHKFFVSRQLLWAVDVQHNNTQSQILAKALFR